MATAGHAQILLRKRPGQDAFELSTKFTWVSKPAEPSNSYRCSRAEFGATYEKALAAVTQQVAAYGLTIDWPRGSETVEVDFGHETNQRLSVLVVGIYGFKRYERRILAESLIEALAEGEASLVADHGEDWQFMDASIDGSIRREFEGLR
ncbi:MAG: hypothetical protein AAF517_23260 [Planctomycetota bacterium]